MGFMDKLKNIFFEEEDEEEIDEPVAPKIEKEKEKEIKQKPEKASKEKLKDVIAKKVDFSKSEKNKNLKVEQEEAVEVEIPVEEEKEKKVEEVVAPKIVEKTEPVKPKREQRINTELIFDDEDFILDTKPKVKKVETKPVEKKVEPKEDINNLYRGRDTKTETKKNETKYDYKKPTYGKKEEAKPKTFTPSPIISPIYGILDKNYKKEEVKDNKEIRISSRPSRMDLDSVRNKAFGDLEYDLIGNMKEEETSVKPDKNISKSETLSKEELSKLKSDEEEKPVMDRVTLGEADEYYNDLGLAYNTDYKDLSKDVNDGKVNSNKKKKEEEKLEDNLFDLIESMYDREE